MTIGQWDLSLAILLTVNMGLSSKIGVVSGITLCIRQFIMLVPKFVFVFQWQQLNIYQPTYNESTNLFTCSCIDISLHSTVFRCLDSWILIASICRGGCLSDFSNCTRRQNNSVVSPGVTPTPKFQRYFLKWKQSIMFLVYDYHCHVWHATSVYFFLLQLKHGSNYPVSRTWFYL